MVSHKLKMRALKVLFVVTIGLSLVLFYRAIWVRPEDTMEILRVLLLRVPFWVAFVFLFIGLFLGSKNPRR